MRSGTGSASRTRTMRCSVASSSDQVWHPRQVREVGIDRLRRPGPRPRRRAGPTAPRGWCRIAWRGGRPTGRVGSRRPHWSRGRPHPAGARGGAGDRVATTAFVRRTQPEVWRVCARLGDRADADDLTQEVYLRALPALAAFRGESSARTWLLQITRYVCADHVRGRARAGGRWSTGSSSGWRPATSRAVDRSGEVDLDDLVGGARSRSTGGLRAHPGRRPLLRRGRDGVRGADRHHPLAGRPGARRPARRAHRRAGERLNRVVARRAGHRGAVRWWPLRCRLRSPRLRSGR